MHQLCTSHFNCVPLLSGTYLLVKNIKKKKKRKEILLQEHGKISLKLGNE